MLLSKSVEDTFKLKKKLLHICDKKVIVKKKNCEPRQQITLTEHS